jgi:histidinol-phosphate aminotransferase
MPISLSRRVLLTELGVSALASTTLSSLGHPSLHAALRRSVPATPKGPIRLDRNENPYGASPEALATINNSLDVANRYPSSEIGDLANKIARLHKVESDQVTLGAGSLEILRMAAEAFLTAGKKLILGSPTFDRIAGFAARAGAGVVPIPLTPTYSCDLDAMLAKVDSTTGLIYICNPNNPTGTLTLRNDIEAFLRKLPVKCPVIVDEAYHHYVNAFPSYASFMDHPFGDERLIVVRTFSKIYGLAGLRVGYAVSSPRLARTLSAARLAFGVNVLGARAAASALDDSEHVRLCAKRNTDDRQEFFNQANARMNRWIDSHTNFVMMKTGLAPERIVEHFKENNILLGPLVPQMPKYVRISLGKPEDMVEFWRVWDMLPSHPMAM